MVLLYDRRRIDVLEGLVACRGLVLVYHPRSAAQYSQELARKWAPSMVLWGAGAGIAALYFLSVTPKIKRTILVKVPVLGSYYEDKTPACDKPF